MKRFFTLLSADGNRTDQCRLHNAVIHTRTPFHIQPLFSPQLVMKYLRGQSPFDNRKIYPFPTVILCDDGLKNSQDDSEAGGNGWEVVAGIRTISSCARLPILMLSESAAHDSLPHCYEPGVCHSLHKPSSASGWGSLVESLYVCVACDPLAGAVSDAASNGFHHASLN